MKELIIKDEEIETGKYFLDIKEESNDFSQEKNSRVSGMHTLGKKTSKIGVEISETMGDMAGGTSRPASNSRTVRTSRATSRTDNVNEKLATSAASANRYSIRQAHNSSQLKKSEVGEPDDAINERFLENISGDLNVSSQTAIFDLDAIVKREVITTSNDNELLKETRIIGNDVATQTENGIIGYDLGRKDVDTHTEKNYNDMFRIFESFKKIALESSKNIAELNCKFSGLGKVITEAVECAFRYRENSVGILKASQKDVQDSAATSEREIKLTASEETNDILDVQNSSVNSENEISLAVSEESSNILESSHNEEESSQSGNEDFKTEEAKLKLAKENLEKHIKISDLKKFVRETKEEMEEDGTKSFSISSFPCAICKTNKSDWNQRRHLLARIHDMEPDAIELYMTLVGMILTPYEHPCPLCFKRATKFRVHCKKHHPTIDVNGPHFLKYSQMRNKQESQDSSKMDALRTDIRKGIQEVRNYSLVKDTGKKMTRPKKATINRIKAQNILNIINSKYYKSIQNILMNAPPTQKNSSVTRDLITCTIGMRNAHRTGVLSYITVENFQSAKSTVVNGEIVHQIHVFKHKSQKDGPVLICLGDKEHKLLSKWVFSYRPLVALKFHKEDRLFVSLLGEPMGAASILNQNKSFAAKCGLRKVFTADGVPKYKVTGSYEVHDNHQKQTRKVAKFQEHSKTIAQRHNLDTIRALDTTKAFIECNKYGNDCLKNSKPSPSNYAPFPNDNSKLPIPKRKLKDDILDDDESLTRSFKRFRNNSSGIDLPIKLYSSSSERC